MKRIKIGENKNYIYYKLFDNNRYYFMKRLKNNDFNLKKMLKNEIDVLSKLDGLNVPVVVNYSLDMGYIVYEYIDGLNLNNIKIMNINDIHILVLKILDVLSLIHKHGIIHCDIKKSNIILSNDEVYIIDFGISCTDGINNFLGYGSIGYCSIEQINRCKLTVKSDIYSIGILMYELYTGILPFTLDEFDKEKIMKNYFELKVTKSSIINKKIPRYIDDIIDKCLKKDPNDRYSSVDELRKDLYEKLYLEKK